jgi:adenosylcobinamide-GDP ribazoletransferase
MVVSIFVAHIASRFFPLLLIRLLPHVGDLSQSKSKPLADQISVYSLIVAGFWLFLGLLSCSIGIFSQYDVSSFLIPFLVASISFLWMWHIFAKRLQGFTGDCLGATQQVCEVAIYLGMVLSI